MGPGLRRHFADEFVDGMDPRIHLSALVQTQFATSGRNFANLVILVFGEITKDHDAGVEHIPNPSDALACFPQHSSKIKSKFGIHIIYTLLCKEEYFSFRIDWIEVEPNPSPDNDPFAGLALVPQAYEFVSHPIVFLDVDYISSPVDGKNVPYMQEVFKFDEIVRASVDICFDIDTSELCHLGTGYDDVSLTCLFGSSICLVSFDHRASHLEVSAIPHALRYSDMLDELDTWAAPGDRASSNPLTRSIRFDHRASHLEVSAIPHALRYSDMLDELDTWAAPGDRASSNPLTRSIRFDHRASHLEVSAIPHALRYGDMLDELDDVCAFSSDQRHVELKVSI